jgi:hypothetical protein
MHVKDVCCGDRIEFYGGLQFKSVQYIAKGGIN